MKDDIQKQKSRPHFKEWQIWWCAVGENVGVEINGKGVRFARPVIIFKKMSRYGFMGVPLTTQNHLKTAPDWYVYFKFQGKDEYAALHQMVFMSVYRLYRQIGVLDDDNIFKIKDGFNKLYCKKIPLL